MLLPFTKLNFGVDGSDASSWIGLRSCHAGLAGVEAVSLRVPVKVSVRVETGFWLAGLCIVVVMVRDAVPLLKETEKVDGVVSFLGFVLVT